MQFKQTRLPEVIEVVPVRHGDHRGFFSEVWNRDAMAAQGLHLDFCQDNHSMSAQSGVLRGLHFQSPPRAQAKLVRVANGSILDVAVDIRRGSPRFGQWVSSVLSAENGRQLLVPEGFAHGFVTLEPDTHVLYKCTDTYAPELEGSIRWDDPDIGIDWGKIQGNLILSDKDANAAKLADIISPFDFES